MLLCVVCRDEQHRADKWLQEFRGSADSWRLCLELLASPSVQEEELYFASNTLKFSCCKSPQLVAQETVSLVLPQLVQRLFDALQRSNWWVSEAAVQRTRDRTGHQRVKSLSLMPAWQPASQPIRLPPTNVHS